MGLGDFSWAGRQLWTFLLVPPSSKVVGFTGDSSGLGGFGGCGVLAWVSLVVGDFSWGGGHKLALSLVSQLTRVRFPRGCSSCFCEMDFLVLVGVSLVLGDFSWGNRGVWTLSLVSQFRLGGIWGAGSCVPPAMFRGEAFVGKWVSGHVLTWSLVIRSTLGGHV